MNYVDTNLTRELRKGTCEKQNNSPYKSDRMKAWRNLMVTAINEGLMQGIFTLDEKNMPRCNAYQFIDDGVHYLVNVRDIGWGELEFEVGASFDGWPEYWRIEFAPASMPIRAFGWLERRDGKMAAKWRPSWDKNSGAVPRCAG
jgi:hypothetical protein